MQFGKKSKVYYNKKGIKVIGDILSTPLYRIIELFGKHGKWVWEIVNGLDKREVKEFHGKRKSISKERTLFKNTDDFKEIFSRLQEINEKIHLSIVKNGIFYKTITLKIMSYCILKKIVIFCYVCFIAKEQFHDHFFSSKSKILDHLILTIFLAVL